MVGLSEITTTVVKELTPRQPCPGSITLFLMNDNDLPSSAGFNVPLFRIPLMLLTIDALSYEVENENRIVELGVPDVNVSAVTCTSDTPTGRLLTTPAARLFMFAKLLPIFVELVSSIVKARSKAP